MTKNTTRNLKKRVVSVSSTFALFFQKYKHKIIVEKDNLNYLNQELVLITCTDDDKRLLILAKKDI